MSIAKTLGLALAAVTVPALAYAFAAPDGAAGSGGGRVFEMRTYYTHPGRLNALNKRFREHTNRIFQKHGMQLVGYWTPLDEKDGRDDKLVYILAYPSRDAVRESWKAFQADPEWKKAKDASEADGPIVKKVESIFLEPTDYSPIK